MAGFVTVATEDVVHMAETMRQTHGTAAALQMVLGLLRMGDVSAAEAALALEEEAAPEDDGAEASEHNAEAEAELEAEPEAEPEAAEEPAEVPPAAEAAEPAGKRPRTWCLPRQQSGLFSEERNALLRRLWQQPGLRIRDILLALNELPGTAILHDARVYAQAKLLDLGVRNTKPAPASADETKAEDLREAEEMIRRGDGARAVAEYFGWPLAEAQDLAKRVRAEGGA